MVKERPILFSTPMAVAIIEDTKAVTRRLNGLEKINQEPDDWYWTNSMATTEDKREFFFKHRWYEGDNTRLLIPCPYGKPGDILWVRETWCIERIIGLPGKFIRFKSDTDPQYWTGYKWHPSIHMKKTAARIYLEITDIRVQRLNDITIEDAIAEGIKLHVPVPGDGQPMPVLQFKTLWQSINGKDSWQKNPWVWVVSFKVLSKTGRPANLPEMEAAHA